MEGTGRQGLARQPLREAARGLGISGMALEVPAPSGWWQRQVLQGGDRGEGHKGRKSRRRVVHADGCQEAPSGPPQVTAARARQ